MCILYEGGDYGLESILFKIDDPLYSSCIYFFLFINKFGKQVWKQAPMAISNQWMLEMIFLV